MNKNFVISLFFLLGSATLSAQVKLLPIFSDNMVFQQQQPIKVWGWADPKESVEISFLHQVKKAKADKNGKWQLELDAVGSSDGSEKIYYSG
jgi:sialate O-acetylesterase